MATTIPGGAYRDTAGAWRDANGITLTEEQIAAAKALNGGPQVARKPKPKKTEESDDEKAEGGKAASSDDDQ